MNYKYLVKISGVYSPFHGSIKGQIADMLRYDGGKLVEVTKDEPVEGLRTNHRYEAIVELSSYTPERWRSFGIRSSLISKEKGVVEGEFDTMEAVSKFINEDSEEAYGKRSNK